MSGAVRRYLLLGAIVVIVLVVAFVFRDRLSGNAGDLAVGDCFDAPTLDGQTVSDVQHHPCTEPHTGEVFAVVTNPAADAAYPEQPAGSPSPATRARRRSWRTSASRCDSPPSTSATSARPRTARARATGRSRCYVRLGLRP